MNKQQSSSTPLLIPLTPTIESVRDELSGKGGVSTWEVVGAILNRHSEYGRKTARDIAGSKGPIPEKKETVQDWLTLVSSLYDPYMVSELNGRLVIIGLCMLEENLAGYLRSAGFLTALEDELYEDYLSLLNPEAAKEEAYRRTFIQVLQNQAKLKKEIGLPVRRTGFVIVVDGGPGLGGLAELCQRQRYNKCFTARYIVPAGSSLHDPLVYLIEDLTGLSRGDSNTIGTLVPDPSAAQKNWNSLPLSNLMSMLESIKGNLEKMTVEDILGSILRLGSQDVLRTGIRLIFFIEFRAVPEEYAIEKTGLTEGVLKLLSDLPERMGIVFSGLPESIRKVLKGPHITHLKLPKDPLLRRGQALSNDIPAGPDRLNIIPEVHALAESITLKDMTPPMVIGVLGGWGSGKSFVLHLLEDRIQEIRCEMVMPEKYGNHMDDPLFPFVGHPYLIRFDAWTYAKSNLWASLMQTIFVELDRQISLEQILSKKLGISLLENTEIWRVVSQMSAENRERLTKTELGRKAVNIVASMESGKISANKLWEILSQLQDTEKYDLRDAEAGLADRLQTRDRALHELEEIVEKELELEGRRAAWKTVKDNLLQSAFDTLSKQYQSREKKGGPPVPTYDEIQERVNWTCKFWKGRGAFSIAFIVFAAVSTGITMLPAVTDKLLPALTSAMCTVAGIFSWIKKIQNWVDSERNKFNGSVGTYLAKYGTTREEMINRAVVVASRNEESSNFPINVLSQAGYIADLNKKIESENANIQALRQRVGITGRHTGLMEFIRERIEGKYYEDKLGLLHQVKSDIEELTTCLMHPDALAKLFPRGKPRIFLLIDDLDRCPPDRVVQVLEAAQLLVKTHLFVVVLAMDVRYITRALEVKYKDVLIRGGEPSGLDYIEKIIQVPYRVRPVSPSAVGSFLRSQMVLVEDGSESPGSTPQLDGETMPPELGAKSGKKTRDIDKGEESRIASANAGRTELRVLPTDTVKFTPDEHKAISDCCAAIEVSPRAMKRLVNVYKLLKIIWYRQGLKDGPGNSVQQAMLSLLALGARHPDVMRQVLSDMEIRYARGQDTMDKNICSTMSEMCLQRARYASFPKDWEAVATTLRDSDFFPSELSFRELQDVNLRLVSSFSFVGESDPEREAALQRIPCRVNDTGIVNSPNNGTDTQAAGNIDNDESAEDS